MLGHDALSGQPLGSSPSAGGPTSYSQALTATLSSTGTSLRASSVKRTAALSFSGLVGRRFPFVLLTASLSFAGSRITRAGKALAAALGFTGPVR